MNLGLQSLTMHVVISDQSHNRSCHLVDLIRAVIGLVKSDADKHRVVLPISYIDDQVSAFGSKCHGHHAHLHKEGLK